MYFFARLRIDLQISIFGFSHELLVFSIFYRENVKSESSTPLIHAWRFIVSQFFHQPLLLLPKQMPISPINPFRMIIFGKMKNSVFISYMNHMPTVICSTVVSKNKFSEKTSLAKSRLLVVRLRLTPF